MCGISCVASYKPDFLWFILRYLSMLSFILLYYNSEHQRELMVWVILWSQLYLVISKLICHQGYHMPQCFYYLLLCLQFSKLSLPLRPQNINGRLIWHKISPFAPAYVALVSVFRDHNKNLCSVPLCLPALFSIQIVQLFNGK